MTITAAPRIGALSPSIVADARASLISGIYADPPRARELLGGRLLVSMFPKREERLAASHALANLERHPERVTFEALRVELTAAGEDASAILDAIPLPNFAEVEGIPDCLAMLLHGDALATLTLGAALGKEEEAIEAGPKTLPTGFPRLDLALGGGLGIPSLNMLGAPPKASKSTLAQIVGTQVVEAGGYVYHLDLENGRRRFVRRMLCRRAQLGGAQVAAALRAQRAGGVFASRQEVEHWNEAKRWLRETIGPRYLLECKPPSDFVARMKEIRQAAGTRPALVIIDSLQKLLAGADFDDRRSATDRWIRIFESARYDHEIVFLVISEIKRGKDGYAPREDAFKESGGIEYAADLAMTLSRPSADEDTEAPATLRVELARDTDEDPRGEVASYQPARPYYGLEEVDPVAIRGKPRRSGPKAEKTDGASDFLLALLAGGPVRVPEVLAQGEAAGFSASTLRRAGKALELVSCSPDLKPAWRLP